MFPIYLEQIFSFFWSVCWLILTLILVITEIMGQQVFTEYLWKSQFLSFVCLFQFAVAVWLESHYDKNIIKNTWSVVWYPVVYWYINVFITLTSLVKALLPKKKLATWKSPDRGITASNTTNQEPDFKMEDPVEEKAFVSYDDIRISRLVQAFSANPENADLSSPLIDGTLESPIVDSNSSEHIENHTKQKKIKQVIEFILTAVAWLYMIIYWAFMMYGIFCDLTGRPIREFWIYNSSTIHQTEHFFFILFIAILIEILVMLIWKEYNYLRFGRLKRRKFKPDVLEKEIDEYFELKEDIKNALHHDKYIVLYKNPIPEGIGQGRGNKKRRPAENNSTAGRPGNR